MSDTTSVRPTARSGAAFDLMLGLTATVGLAAGAARMLELPGPFVAQAVALYAVVSLMILRALPRASTAGGSELRKAGLGPANRVTLARLVLVVPLTALVLHPEALDAATRWAVVAFGSVALALDGVDGWVARRTGSASPFGARFDMETDAWLLMVLSILAWQSGQVAPWVLFIGAMRYLFVAAGWVVSDLRGSLPPSLRRKVVCVIQGIALLVAVGPVVPPAAASAAAGAAVVSLAWSFAVDTAWLLRNGSPGPALVRGVSSG